MASPYPPTITWANSPDLEDQPFFSKNNCGSPYSGDFEATAWGLDRSATSDMRLLWQSVLSIQESAVASFGNLGFSGEDGDRMKVINSLWTMSVRCIYLLLDLKDSQGPGDISQAILRFTAHCFEPSDLVNFVSSLKLGDEKTWLDTVSSLDFRSFFRNGFYAMDWTEKLGDFSKKFADLPHSEVFRKTCKVLLGFLCFPFLKSVGLQMSEYGLFEFSERHQKRFRFGSLHEMISSVVDMISTLARVGHVCFAERSLAPLLRVDNDVQDFIDRVDKIRDQVTASFSDPMWDSNPVIAEIMSLRETGHVLMLCSEHKYFISKEVTYLDKIFTDLSQRSGVSAFRKAPFGVLIYGTPGIGKSFVTNLVVSYYHQVVTQAGIYPDLKWDPKINLWTKNFMDDYDSDYRGASHWAVVMDDLAQENVNHVKAGQTNSVRNLFSFVNNVGYASTQADLEYKGKIPKVPKLVVASTNVKMLNAYHAVEEPSAALRRLPVVIQPILKPQFKDAKSGIMKSLDHVERDCWEYRVEEVKLIVQKGQPMASHVLVTGDLPNGNMTPKALFPYLREKILAHERAQEALKEALAPGKGDQMCTTCYLPGHYCSCEQKVEACSAPVGDFLTVQKKVFSLSERILIRLAVFAYDRLGFFTRWGIVRPAWYVDYVPRWLAVLLIRRKIQQRVPSLFRNFSKVVLYSMAPVALVQLVLAAFRFAQQRKTEGMAGIWTKEEDFFRPPNTTQNDGGVSLQKTLEKSMMSITLSAANDKPRVLCAVSLGDGRILTTAHPFKSAFDEWAILVRYSPTLTVSECLHMLVKRSQLTFVEGTDLVIINSSYNVARRNLIDYIPDEAGTKTGPIRILSRDSQGQFQVDTGVLTSYQSSFKYGHEGSWVEVDGAYFFRRGKGDTIKGDCGSIVIAESRRGWYVHSIICAGDSAGNGVSIPLRKKKLIGEPIYSTFESCSFFEAGSPSTGPLLPPSERSLLRWAEPGHGEEIGSFEGRHRPSSRVLPTEVSAELYRVLDIQHQYVPPMMKWEKRGEQYVCPWTINLNEQLATNTKIADCDLEGAARAFLDDLLVEREWLKDVGPVSEHVAINGIIGNEYVNVLPMSTSAGFLKSGPKRDLFVREIDGYVPKEMLAERLVELRATYAKGHRACALMNAHLKDEPVPQAKVDAGKTRVFTSSSVDFSIVMREQFLRVNEAIMRHNIHSECMVGMNCYGPAWEDLYDHLTHGGTVCDRIIGGDFSKYDKKMSCAAIRWAFWILIELNKVSGLFSEEDLLIQRGLMTDTCFPYVNYNGDVIMFYGSNSSGHPLTVIINSIVNSLYMRVGFSRVTKRPVSDFRKFVRLATLGDDNIMTSLDETFNHSSLAAELASIGIVYTMADKSSVSIPFISIYDADFLKRKFVHLEGVCAPLELESTYKSLVAHQERGNITSAQQLSETYLSARREWSLHGEEVFNHLTTLVDPIIRSTEAELHFIAQHSAGWRKTFDWVRSGEFLLPDAPPLNDFVACSGLRNWKQRREASELAIRELERCELTELNRLVDEKAERARQKLQARRARKRAERRNYKQSL